MILLMSLQVFHSLIIGLGTSSILGGVVMGALWRAVGQHHSPDSLIHAVKIFYHLP